MPNKDSNISTMNKNKETIKKVSSKVHEELLSTSHLFIDETVATLTRMQKITGNVIKKSEPIIEKQIEITFEAVEALKDQAEKGGKRALKLLGLTKQFNKLSDTIEKKIEAIPSAEEMIEDAKEFVAEAKSDVEGKIGELGKKLKIEKMEEIGAAKVGAKKIVEKVVSKTKAVAKPAAKKAPAKKAVAKKVTAKKVATTKITATTPVIKKAVQPTDTVVTPKKTVPAAAKAAVSELTQINGIGPSLAAIMTDNGIKTIKDLQDATPTALKIIATKAGNRYKSFDTEKWVIAANAIAK